MLASLSLKPLHLGLWDCSYGPSSSKAPTLHCDGTSHPAPTTLCLPPTQRLSAVCHKSRYTTNTRVAVRARLPDFYVAWVNPALVLRLRWSPGAEVDSPHGRLTAQSRGRRTPAMETRLHPALEAHICASSRTPHRTKYASRPLHAVFLRCGGYTGTSTRRRPTNVEVRLSSLRATSPADHLDTTHSPVQRPPAHVRAPRAARADTPANPRFVVRAQLAAAAEPMCPSACWSDSQREATATSFSCTQLVAIASASPVALASDVGR
ncbi:hypothetical protein B0H10DRAFT_2215190 [Mycena sp. CBHHK59/15]|nr:hypothetical protein B0H10DRAFT_2215190 [Mycena sp. CBHHK59/15]